MHQKDLVQILTTACNKRDITFQTYSDNWLIEMKKGVKTHWVAGQNFDLNTQANSVMARDKVASSTVMKLNKVACVEHFLLDRREQHDSNLPTISQALLHSGAIVMKPLNGHGGQNVAMVRSAEEARRHILSNQHTAWAYCGLRSVSAEVRIVVVDGEIQIALHKSRPVIRDGLKLYNLSQGASAERLDYTKLDKKLSVLATDAMRALGLRIGAVDILLNTDGSYEVLEVNAIFSLMRYSKINDATYADVASFYDRLVYKLFTE